MTLNEMIRHRKSCRSFTGKPVDAEAFRSGVLKLQEENLAAMRAQMEEFLNAN